MKMSNITEKSTKEKASEIYREMPGLSNEDIQKLKVNSII